MAQDPPNFGSVSFPSDDNNLALVIHCYNPGVFTHQGCTWADASYTSQARLTDSHRSTLNWDLNQVKAYRDAHAIPIVMNEFNVAHQIADQGDVTEYLGMVTRFCESNDIPWSPWLYFGSGEDQMNVRRRDGGWHDFIMDGLFPDLKTTDAFTTNDYAHAMDITFAGYAGASPLADFPALVKLSEGIRGFSYADFLKPSGGDLRFTDASGALIPHEIDTWDTNGTSLVWVKVPSLTAAASVTAHYGCAKPCVPKVESVWDENYAGVWHLGEGALPLKDSSDVSRDFTASDGTDIGYAAPGVAGGAVDFGESGTGRGLFAADHDALDGFTAFTIEAWTWQTDHATNAGILAKRKGFGNQVSYYFYDNGTTETIYVAGDGSAAASLGLAPAPALGRWNHQAITYDSAAATDNASAYLNGVLSASTTRAFGVVTNAAGELCLGNLHSGNAANFPGKIDEVRISRCARSADWLRATHDTVVADGFARYAVRGVAPPPPTPVVAEAEGCDWTNRLFAVTGLAPGAEVTLTLANGGASTPGEPDVASAVQMADSTGTASFSPATVPGALYAYTLSTNGVAFASGSFLAGAWDADGSWFSAAPDGNGGSVERGGAWTLPPEATNATAYVVGAATAFTLTEAARARRRTNHQRQRPRTRHLQRRIRDVAFHAVGRFTDGLFCCMPTGVWSACIHRKE